MEARCKTRSTFSPIRAPARWRGFTLVELLVVIGIIAVLIGLLMPALTAARKQAQTVRDLSSLRTLMHGFLAYAGENRGRVLPGYWNLGQAVDDRGVDVTFPANARYPWRLMPYLNKVVRGSVLSGDQETLLGNRDAVDAATWSYEVSVYPSFGMNVYGVGGDLYNPRPDWMPKLVSRLGEPSNATDLIVFASSRYNADGYHEGFHKVCPPLPTATFVFDDPATNFGFLHPRYSKNARVAVALFDGHAETMDTDEVKKSQHWFNARFLPFMYPATPIP